MDSKTRVIQPILMAGLMAFMVTLIATSLNLGWHAGFLASWMKSYVLAWPVAAATGWLVLPTVHVITQRIVARLDSRTGRRPTA